MSCYILPAGPSAFVNLAAVYQQPSAPAAAASTSFLIGAGCPSLGWPTSATAAATSGMKLPVAPAAGVFGTSCGAGRLVAGGDQLNVANATAATLAIVSPEVASSFVYHALYNTGNCSSRDPIPHPAATSNGSFSCIVPTVPAHSDTAPSSTSASGYSFPPYPDVAGGSTAVYNYTTSTTGVSTFRIIAQTDVPGSLMTSSSVARRIRPLPSGTRPPHEFYRLRRLLRRVRRRLAAGLSAVEDDDDDGSGSKEADGESAERYPLYCVVCRVKLNATAQAKQHYTGRSHARRVRLLYGSPESDPSFNILSKQASSLSSSASSSVSASSPSSCSSPMTEGVSPTTSKYSGDSDSRLAATDIDEVDDTKQQQTQVATSSISVSGPSQRPLYPAGTVAPVSCDVYCSACAVSFNSTIQARQHYHGKSHAKRLKNISPEFAPTASSSNSTQSTSGDNTLHKDALYTCLICNARPGQSCRSSQHATTTPSSSNEYSSSCSNRRKTTKHSDDDNCKRQRHSRHSSLPYL